MNIRTTIITLCLLLTGAAAHASPSAEEVIDGVNKGLYPGYRAVATGDTLILEGRGNRKTIPMPKDRFYLAAAPYISGTHPWTYHNISGCKSELRNKTFKVTVVSRRGDIIFDDTVTTLPNGFMELWLPRDLTDAVLTIGYHSMEVSTLISTGKGSPTCLTTPLRLR